MEEEMRGFFKALGFSDAFLDKAMQSEGQVDPREIKNISILSKDGKVEYVKRFRNPIKKFVDFPDEKNQD